MLTEKKNVRIKNVFFQRRQNNEKTIVFVCCCYFSKLFVCGLPKS